jgi:hypothetical protein
MPTTTTKEAEAPTPLLPNLVGRVEKERIEHIGTGKYQASYLNWARTFNILREHSPDWLVECEYAPDGTLVHKAPVGGYLMLRLHNIRTGLVTPSVPQAVMDNRNGSIPYEKITSRDITDTQRRGGCLLLAQQTGLASELWAKDPLESGYSGEESSTSPLPGAGVAGRSADAATKESDFVEAATAKGLNELAIAGILKKLKDANTQNFSAAINSLAGRDAAWVEASNAAHIAEAAKASRGN